MLIQEKKKPYLLNIIDRTTIKQDKRIIQHETILIRVTIRKYTKEINLDIIMINNHQAIFSIPWIKQYNPEIN
jgi:hypothetical protein